MMGFLNGFLGMGRGLIMGMGRGSGRKVAGSGWGGMGLWMGREGKGVGRFDVEDCVCGLRIECAMYYVMKVIYCR